MNAVNISECLRRVYPIIINDDSAGPLISMNIHIPSAVRILKDEYRSDINVSIRREEEKKKTSAMQPTPAKVAIKPKSSIFNRFFNYFG